MAYPLPIVRCEKCKKRFILDPEGTVEDEELETVEFVCHECRDPLYGSSPEPY